MIDECLERWSRDDLAVEFSRQRVSGTETVTREWVIWHLIEHDLHHGGEISLILGSHGSPLSISSVPTGDVRVVPQSL